MEYPVEKSSFFIPIFLKTKGFMGGPSDVKKSFSIEMIRKRSLIPLAPIKNIYKKKYAYESDISSDNVPNDEKECFHE